MVKVWFFRWILNFSDFLLGGRFSLTLISHWREWWIQKQFWSYCYSLGLMRPTSVDTQKTTMNAPVTTDCLENQIFTCNTKIVSSVNPGQIQKISDCDIKDKTVEHIRPALWPACRSATPHWQSIHPFTLK
jgi:hypothetical protein